VSRVLLLGAEPDLPPSETPAKRYRVIHARSGSGCLRPPWVAGALLLLAIAAAPAVAQRKPACINPDAPCDDPNLVAACEEFRSCQSEFRDELTACVEDKCQCDEGQTGCRFPITPGRCTITLDCVHRCARETTRLPSVPSTKACIRELKTALRGTDEGCRVTSAAARRACKKCATPIPRACTPAFEDRGSRCQQNCVLRVLEKVAQSKDCYSRCGGRCKGNGCATAMCQRACRDSVCKKLRKFCSPDASDDGETDDETDGDPGLQKLNIGYRVCCEGDNADCDLDSDDTLLCNPTTTSSTSTTTSTSSSSTASSRPTTTSTLSTTGTTLG